MSLEGDAGVRLDVEESFVELVIWAEAIDRLAEAGVSHVEVRTAAKGRGALTSLAVHQTYTTQICETFMSTYINKCGVINYLQSRLAGGLRFKKNYWYDISF